MKETKFYYSKDSKTILIDIGDSSSQCRNEGMVLLEANTVDAAEEKHIPVYDVVKDVLTVKVGTQPHPMQPDHFIEWIYVQTATGGHYRKLSTGNEPKASFPLHRDEDVLGVYAYCNLHGLWKASKNSRHEFHEAVCSAEFPECIES